jgi:hypothetical protein
MSDESHAPLQPPDAELADLLERNREALLRRWLTLIVERASLEELAATPLARRVEDLDLLLEAAGSQSAGRRTGERASQPRDGLRAELERQLDAHGRSGEPFSIAVLSVPAGAGGADQAAWGAALRDAVGEPGAVLDGGDGATAVVLPGHAGPGARTAIDRIRVEAWGAVGDEGGLIDAGIATCPDDGTSPHELLAVAHERLGGASDRAPRDVPERGRFARLLDAQESQTAHVAEVAPLRRP